MCGGGAEAAEPRPEAFWEDLRYGPDGLVPVVVADRRRGTVLMLAYADREAARRTAVERRAWFWSRSRRRLWRKGETSGHVLDVAEVRWDCDADALLYLVDASGPTCHTGAESCFHRGERPGAGASPEPDPAPAGTRAALAAEVAALEEVVAARGASAPPGSYVGALLRAGPARALQKLGEEAVEAVIAGLRASADPGAATGEFADVLFHLLVAMAACGVPAAAVAAELERRRGLRPGRGPGIPASDGGIG